VATSARHGEVSIHVEEPCLPTVQQILATTVEELHSEMQACDLLSGGAVKPDLQYALLRSVEFLPPVEPIQAAASLDDASSIIMPEQQWG